MIEKAIIIGATSGIGLEVARRLWRDGAVVGVAGRRADRLEAFEKECGCRVTTQQLDVTAEDSGEKLLLLVDKLGGADLIFICSGVGSQNADLNAEVELTTAETNVVGFMRIAVAAFNYFKANGGGHIAAVSSIAGTKGLGIAPAYSATKRFQNIYLQCLAQLSSMQCCNIAFTDIRPGFVDTDLLKSGKYPMLMKPDYVARKIVKALYRKERVVVIDWKYRILVAFWRMIPDFIWEKLRIVK